MTFWHRPREERRLRGRLCGCLFSGEFGDGDGSFGVSGIRDPRDVAAVCVSHGVFLLAWFVGVYIYIYTSTASSVSVCKGLKGV